MNSAFDTSVYFFNLIVLSVVMVPLLVFVPKTAIKKTLMVLVGMYLLYLIAPRLALFYLVFWCLVYGLQKGTGAFAEKIGGIVFFWASSRLSPATAFLKA